MVLFFLDFLYLVGFARHGLIFEKGVVKSSFGGEPMCRVEVEHAIKQIDAVIVSEGTVLFDVLPQIFAVLFFGFEIVVKFKLVYLGPVFVRVTEDAVDKFQLVPSLLALKHNQFGE